MAGRSTQRVRDGSPRLPERTSPPPAWNFVVLPQVQDRDEVMRRKGSGADPSMTECDDIALPGRSAVGAIVAVTGTLLGFALVWHIWWLAAAALAAAVALVIAIGFRSDTTETFPAGTITAVDAAFQTRRRAALAGVPVLAGDGRAGTGKGPA